MFANVRLMIVAISASLLAVVCAMALFMGVFAVFSVAHEPFSDARRRQAAAADRACGRHFHSWSRTVSRRRSASASD